MCPAPAGRLRRYRSFLTIGRTRRGISPFPLRHKKTAHWGRFLYGGEGGMYQGTSMCPAPAGRLRRYRSFLTIGRTRRGISLFPLRHKKSAHWGRFLYGGEGGIYQGTSMCPAPAGRLRRYRSFLTIGRTRRGISPFPLHHKKTAHWGRFLYGGEGGIRTLDTGLGYTPLAGERLQPLGHLSENCLPEQE